MSDYVVWMDSQIAQIFALKTLGIVKSQLQKKTIDHHNKNKKDHYNDGQIDHYYRDLAVLLKDVEQLLILGPGEAKGHFKTYLETHHAHDLAKKIIGVENSDHPTDNQILASARKFFKTYDLFNSSIQPS